MPVVGYFVLQYQNYTLTYYTFCVVKCLWIKLSTLVFHGLIHIINQLLIHDYGRGHFTLFMPLLLGKVIPTESSCEPF
jgi:hypothetical protein